MLTLEPHKDFNKCVIKLHQKGKKCQFPQDQKQNEPNEANYISNLWQNQKGELFQIQ